MKLRLTGFLSLLAVLLCLAAPVWAAGNEAEMSKATGDDPNKPHYVKIAPLILPVIGDKGIEQIVSIVIVIEAPNKDAATDIIELSPRLNDAYISALYGTFDRRDKMANGILDVNALKDRLTQITTKILGEDKFKSLLIQGVSQRPV